MLSRVARLLLWERVQCICGTPVCVSLYALLSPTCSFRTYPLISFALLVKSQRHLRVELYSSCVRCGTNTVSVTVCNRVWNSTSDCHHLDHAVCASSPRRATAGPDKPHRNICRRPRTKAPEERKAFEMPSLSGGRVRPSLRHVRSIPEYRGSRSNSRIKFFCCCFPIREYTNAEPSSAERGQKDSLLEKYGIDELSDTDGESDVPDNPMSPEQIARMRTCRTRA